jgi:hypothetical protein
MLAGIARAFWDCVIMGIRLTNIDCEGDRTSINQAGLYSGITRTPLSNDASFVL